MHQEAAELIDDANAAAVAQNDGRGGRAPYAGSDDRKKGARDTEDLETEDPEDKDAEDEDAEGENPEWLDPAERYCIYQIDPAANRPLMRRLEVLTDLALLAVCDDSVLVGSEVYPRGRQSLNPEGDFCRISFWAPAPVLEDLNLFLDCVREKAGPMPVWASLMILVREAVHTWTTVDQRKKPRWWRVFERDEYRCQCPACSKRSLLHGHHAVYRSHQGSDELCNVVASCYTHHQQGIHQGHMRAAGDANQGLRWTLGPRAKRGGPFRVYQGDLRVE